MYITRSITVKKSLSDLFLSWAFWRPIL